MANNQVESTDSEMESPLYSQGSQPPRRSWRGPVMFGFAYVLLAAGVVIWATRSHAKSASSRVDNEAVELDAVWNGGQVVVNASRAKLRGPDANAQAQAQASLVHAAIPGAPIEIGQGAVATPEDTRELLDTPGSVCKEPPPVNVFLSSGPQCQQSMLYSDRTDGSIIAINLVISDDNLAILNNAPKAGEYVDCSVVVNYQQTNEVTTVGGRCRYKGSTGSFMGCLNKENQADYGGADCRMLSMKIKVNKDLQGNTVLTTNGDKAKDVLQTKEIQLAGMMHDDSLLRNHLGYKILQWNDIVGSCTVPANVYYNGVYQGLADLMEPVDDYFLKKRETLDPWKADLQNDPDDGDNTLWKELWPESADPNYYSTVQEIPNFASRSMKNEGSAGNAHDLYANFYKEAEECFLAPSCSKATATRIVEKYTHPKSFIDGIVGMVLSANSDQPILIKHNFFLYVFPDANGNNKFYYVSWDYNQVLYDITGSPIPGYGLDVPWYHIVSEEEKKTLCPYPVPADSQDLSVKRFAAFTCEPIGYVMALAWKDQYVDRINAADKTALVQKLDDEIETWSKKIEGSINCAAANGGWPPSAEEQQKATSPLSHFFRQTISFWKNATTFLGYRRSMTFPGRMLQGNPALTQLETWPSPTFSRFPAATASCVFDGVQAFQYLGHAGIQITDSVRNCRQGLKGEIACASSISNVISSFGFFASFLSSILTECPIRDSMGFAQRGTGKAGEGDIYRGRKNCAAQSSRLIAGLAAASAGAAGLSEMCVPGVAAQNHETARRRLDMVGFEENRPTQEATCSFDIIGAVAYLGRAGTAIDFATVACKGYWYSGAKCAAQVTAVIESVSYIAMYLSSAVAQCAKEVNLPIPEAYRAQCAADISQLNGGLFSVASGASGMASSCGVHWPDDSPYSTTRILTPERTLKEVKAAKLAWHSWLKGDRSKVRELAKRHNP